MATTEPDASTDLDEQEIFGSAVPCQSLIHDLGTWGHDPEAAAEFQLLTPCGRIARNRCAGNVAYLRARGGNFYCRGTSGGCDQRHPMTEITFRPL